MELYDTHCHLHAETFDEDRDLVIDRARNHGVQKVLAVAEDLNDAYRLLEIADRHAGFMIPAIGIHPDRAPAVSDAEVTAVVELIRLECDRLGAVGEVGLDHRPRWEDAARGRQAEVFKEMIHVARELGLPLSVHSRGAGHHAIALLEEEGYSLACLHAFDGRAVHGERGARMGLSFSIPPSVVRSRVKQKLVPRLPLESLLLESDSPVLGPEPDRRNEPCNVVVALTRMAELRGCSRDDLAAALARNTLRRFPRLGPGRESPGLPGGS